MNKKPTEMVQLVHQMRPNDFEDGLLYFWLSNLEYRVFYEVFEQEAPETASTLQVGPPHDDIYWTHLVAMVDFAMGNMEAYAHSSALAEKAWKAFRQYYHQQKYKNEKTGG